MLTAQDVAKALRVSLPWVYRNKHALGAFQLTPGDAVRFPDNCIEIKRKEEYALSNAKREVARNAHDPGKSQDKDIPRQSGSKKMGGGAKRRGMGRTKFADPYNLLD